ncbi:zinc ABC transporter, inner membrane permease protein ZnuB [Lachnospiraceae bacterium KM106-2]|nr:zinc ABC transporter, inner membrane permease protein ZnuB [Lachnospiraceae bacterium KM106-2]
MIGDGLSHVSYGALCIAFALGYSPFYLSIPVVIVAAILLLNLTEKGKLKSDAAIAIFSASSLAIGVIVTSLSSGMNTEVESYMFGSILAMDGSDVILSVILCSVVMIVFILCYHAIFTITFDEDFARSSGLPVRFYNRLLSILIAITIVLGMRMMGAMLISSLIIFPAVTAMQLFRTYQKVILSAIITSSICFVIGLILSYEKSIPAGASIVVTNLVTFLLFLIVSKLKWRVHV